jgi:hypothetical protein
MTSGRRGLVQTIAGVPAECESVFACLNCGKGVYDGGVPRKTECGCGQIWLRDEDGHVKPVAERVHIEGIEDLFSAVGQVPSQPCPDLACLTLGVFETSVPNNFQSEGEVNYNKLGKDLLVPWFLRRQRVLGLGDLFEIRNIRFKVMAAMPTYGRIVQSTHLICFQNLSMVPIRDAILGILQPAPSQILNSSLVSYFRGYPRHLHLSNLHLDQSLYIDGHEFVVLECQPNNGIVAATTPVRLIPNAISPTLSLELYPDPDTLSVAQGVDLMEGFVLPFFRGWRRPAAPGMSFSIAGVAFKIIHTSDGFCFVTEFTDISLSDRRWTMEEFMAMLNSRKGPSGTNLPTRELGALPTDPNLRNCTICQEDYKLKETIKTLPCCELYLVHFFHKGCIEDWLERSSLCPLCKLDVDAA